MQPDSSIISLSIKTFIFEVGTLSMSKEASHTIPEEDKICREAYEETKKLVEEHREVLEMLADILYEREYLSQEDVEAFMQENLYKVN